MPRPRRKRAGVALAALALAATLLPACVTERVGPSRGRPVQRVSNGALVPPRSSPTAAPAPMPTSPVAQPATTDGVVDSRATVAVRPMGSIPFDGQTLPLVSPNGRYLATQVGPAPAWETIAALVGASPSRTRVEVYDLNDEPPKPVANRTEPGLLLGRDATDEGVLVESQRPDGSRWIGFLLWESSEVRWLVRGPEVNAHAVLGDAGELAFTRRDVDQPDAALVLRTATGAERVLTAPGTHAAFPVMAASGAAAMCFARTGAGMECLVLALAEGVSGAPVLARRKIANAFDAGLAYQCVASLQPAHPVPAGPVMFHHAPLARMVTLDAATAELVTLAEGSVAGCRDPNAPPGVDACFLTTPRGLAHQRIITRDAGRTALPESRVLAESWVARPTGAERRPFVLIGPGPARGDTPTLQLAAMAIVPPDTAQTGTTAPETKSPGNRNLHGGRQ